ncbi:DNA replication protein [Desulfohalotomaculum tongense]|uniref:DnaD domain-containing protein n=1 Tax=Desulforadius tongensis TaxID=1216062 RepID=UPI00195AC882|nr:DnaD domain protein [Desulforadius tongensis]MBM7855603.1 DNA replication protein [Desulforadius tongensis]
MTLKNKAVKKYRAGNITAAFGADLLVTGSTSVPNLLLKYYTKLDITDSEMMLLIQLLRLRTEEKNLFPTAEELDPYVNGGAEQVQYLIDSLLDKELLSITQYYDFGKDMVVDGLDFEPLYEKLSELWACDKVKEIEETKNILDRLHQYRSADQLPVKESKSPLREDQPKGQVLNICALFEREFARPLSPMEVERIRHWMDEIDSVLIIEALRRAVLLGKSNFRYIDAILMEWRKNNLRTLHDINRYDEEFKKRRIGRGYSGSRKSQEKRMAAESDKERKKLYDALLMS